MITNVFSESSDIFPNPERGFYQYTHLNALSSGDVDWLYSAGVTLIYGKIVANAYMYTEFLPGSFLASIQNGFDLARTHGQKVNFRMVYHEVYPCSACPDAPKSYMSNHIEQLSPIWYSNQDVLNLVEAGFIGPWGEWHSSELATLSDKRDILFKLLENVPPNRMLAIRYSPDKPAIFTNSSMPGGYDMIDEFSAFSGSPLSRVGFHNDCFVSSCNDVGSYPSCGVRQLEIDYIGSETRFTPWGGETCALSDESFCLNAISEMEQLHATYLNQGYEPSVLNRWTTDGCMDEIKRRLGYRFFIQQVSMGTQVKPGGILRMQLLITNVGFAALFNERPVELKLVSSSTEYTISVETDPRRWLPGYSIFLDKQFRIRSDIVADVYQVCLNFPDASDSLYNDPRYSIRLANENMWDGTMGYNIILSNFHVNLGAPGSSVSNVFVFEDLSGYDPGIPMDTEPLKILEPDGISDEAYNSFNVFYNLSSYGTNFLTSFYYSSCSDGPFSLMASFADQPNGNYHILWDTSGLDAGKYYLRGVLDQGAGNLYTNNSSYPIYVGSSNTISFKAYPNPFSPAVESLTLSFRSDLTDEIGFYIYNLMGDLVCHLSVHDRDQIVWDGTNDRGSLVRPGMYILKMEINGSFRKEYIKILVLK